MPPLAPRPPDRKPAQRLASLRTGTPGRRMQQKYTNESRTTTCPNPTCPDPRIVDDEIGKVCTGCGTILTDTNIVSEVTFGETSSGAAVVQGTYIGPDQSHGRSFGPGFKGSGMESREVTERNGRAIINDLAQKLSIQSTIADRGFQVFKLAINYNVIQGRRTESVAAVALYIACRREQINNTMLIDIADLIKVNVFKLGRTYKALLEKVLIRLMPAKKAENQVRPDEEPAFLSPVSPEDLIARFANQLEFGSDCRKVSLDAVRLVQRMNRDWMTHGRRPGGVCGAALVLAARMNNYRRTVREVVFVVKVTEITIHQRLAEFKNTESGDLTVSEFRTMSLEKAHDPPAFYRAREGKTQKRRIQKRKAPENAEEEAEEGEMSPPPTRRRRIDKDGFAIPDLPIDPALTAQDQDTGVDDTEIDPELTSAVNTALSELEGTVGSNTKLSSAAPTSNGGSSPQAERSNVSASAPTPSQQTTGPKRRPGQKRGRKPRASGKKKVASVALDESEEVLESEMLGIIDIDSLAAGESTKIAAPTTTELESNTTSAPAPKTREAIPDSETISDSEFADDPEVQQCLLTESEIAIKERIWVHENQDYLRQQQAKILKRQLEEESGTARVIKRRKRHKGRMGDVSYIYPDGPSGEGSRASTPAEATRLMLDMRTFSRRINYERLTGLYEDEDESTSAAGDEDGSQGGSATTSATSTPKRQDGFILRPEPKLTPVRRRYRKRGTQGASPAPTPAADALSAMIATPPSSGRQRTTTTSSGVTPATVITSSITPAATGVPPVKPTEPTTAADPDDSDSDMVDADAEKETAKRAQDDETIEAAFGGTFPLFRRTRAPVDLDEDDDMDDEDEDAELDLSERAAEEDFGDEMDYD